MHIFLMCLVVIGISMDIFATVTCQGAMLASIQKCKVLAIGGIFCAGQILAFGVGYLVSGGLMNSGSITATNTMAQWIAGILFGCIGFHMMHQGMCFEPITEHLITRISFKEELWISLRRSLNGLLAGIACGFYNMQFWRMLVSIAGMTILMVALGYYSGFRFGTAPRSSSYIVGSTLLLITGIVILAQCFV